MGKNKGQKSHKATKQLVLKGSTSGAGEARVSPTTGLAGGIVVAQDARTTCPTPQGNSTPLVLDKKPGSSSVATKVVAHQVFDKSSGCTAETETSPNDSYTLEEDDSSTDEDSSPSSGSNSAPQVGNKEASTPWINLFKDNRKPSKGFGLKFSPPSSEGEVLLDEADLQPLEEAWGHNLIGYVASRFPGKKALLECCQKWGMKFSYLTHESGWLVFKFESEDDLNQVLSASPYFIFQRPLLLKVMPVFFDFGNEELSKIPVWVKL